MNEKCEHCEEAGAVRRNEIKGEPVLCDDCYLAYDDKTGYCSLDCCITGKCDESC
jgi:hypothetical protein